MATFKATDLASKPKFMGEFGNAVIANGKAAVTTSLADNDVIYPCIIPAGTEVHAIVVANDDLDSGTSAAIVCDIGFTPVNSDDGPTEDKDYFASGDTGFQGASDGRVFANFDPKKFEYDVFLNVNVTTAAATAKAGSIRTKVLGVAAGVK